MKRAAALTLTAAALTAAANGCSGLSDTPSSAANAQRLQFRPALLDAPPWHAREATQPAPPSPPPATTPVIMSMKPEPTQIDATPDAGDAGANIRLAQSDAFDGYLTDGAGRALYMFVGDVAGARESACLGTCASAWPAFDVLEPQPAAALDPVAIARFHRQDGAWQTTYHGHPLYYRAGETQAHDVSRDGVDQRWFVARDYLAFMASSRTFTPAGGDSPMGAFLTDGFGRTLYVCLDDEPGSAGAEPITSCDEECARTRPIFDASETERTTLLPSALPAGALNELVRADGSLQLTYRGWPLYFFTGDTLAGSTEGHNDQAWRAFDPIRFGRDPTVDPAP
jgi:predicted lipoprotein with Yx(FWY)xxD motif